MLTEYRTRNSDSYPIPNRYPLPSIRSFSQVYHVYLETTSSDAPNCDGIAGNYRFTLFGKLTMCNWDDPYHYPSVQVMTVAENQKFEVIATAPAISNIPAYSKTET